MSKADGATARPPVEKIIAALRAGHQYSGIVDELDIMAADALDAALSRIRELEARQINVTEISDVAMRELLSSTNVGQGRHRLKRILADLHPAPASGEKTPSTEGRAE